MRARLQERDDAVQEQLRSQLEELVNKQELAHERMLLTLSAQSNAIDAREQREQQPLAAAAVAADVNPRLVAPVTDDFTTPAAREVPVQELMTSPLQALRSGALAMAGTQRRTSFARVFRPELIRRHYGFAVADRVVDQEPKSEQATYCCSERR